MIAIKQPPRFLFDKPYQTFRRDTKLQKKTEKLIVNDDCSGQIFVCTRNKGVWILINIELFYFLLDHLDTHLRKLDVLSFFSYIYEDGIRCVPTILQPLLQNDLDCWSSTSIFAYLSLDDPFVQKSLSLSLSQQE